WNLDEAAIAARKNDPRAESLVRDLLPLLNASPGLKWSIQDTLAKSYEHQGRSELAEQWFQNAIQSIEDAVRPLKKAESRIAMLNNWPIYDDYLAFLVRQGRAAQSLQVAQQARALSLAEELGLAPRKQNPRTYVASIQSMLQARKAMALAFYE